MQIHLESGKTIETADMRQEVQPMFCSGCGCRIGWYHDGMCDEPPVTWCDDCAADETEDDADEDTGDTVLEFAIFNSFELGMTLDQAMSVSVPGQDATSAVKALLQEGTIIDELSVIPVDYIRDELRETGAYDDDQLADDAANRERIVWIAGGNIRDGHTDAE